MRTVFIILFSLLPIWGFGQVIENLSFNKETKTIHLTLENKFKIPVLLTSRSPLASPEEGTYYTIVMKNKNGNVLKKRSLYVFDSEPKKRGYYLYLDPLQTKSFQLNISSWANSVYSVEVKLHVEVHNTKAKLNYKNEKDIIKTFLWE